MFIPIQCVHQVVLPSRRISLKSTPVPEQNSGHACQSSSIARRSAMVESCLRPCSKWTFIVCPIIWQADLISVMLQNIWSRCVTNFCSCCRMILLPYITVLLETIGSSSPYPTPSRKAQSCVSLRRGSWKSCRPPKTCLRLWQHQVILTKTWLMFGRHKPSFDYQCSSSSIVASDMLDTGFGKPRLDLSHAI